MIGKLLNILFLAELVHEQGTYFRWHNLAIGLQATGHKVTVYAVDWNRNTANRTEYRDGVKYCITSTYRGFGIFIPSTNPLNFVRRLIIEYPHCDIVHSFQPFPFSAYLGWYLKKTGKATYFFYDWDDLWAGGLYDKPVTRLSDKITYFLVRHTEKKFPSRADAVTVCSRYLQNLAFSLGAKNVSVVHNGFWSFTKIDKVQARKILGLKVDVLYIGFMGRTSAEISWCIDALELLNENGLKHSTRLALCGMPGDLLDQFPTLLRERVDYLGNLSPSDCRLFSSAIDFGLLPLEDNAFNQSRFPIKFAEYQASSTPVIYSEIGECNELSNYFPWNIKAGKTKKQFVDTIVASVNIRLNNKSTLAVNAKQLAKRLSWNLLACKLQNAYMDVMERN